MKSEVMKTLIDLGLTSNETRELFSDRTRDVRNIKVWRDSISEVIYIDDFYVGDNQYVKSEYNQGLKVAKDKLNQEAKRDLERRLSAYKDLSKDKNVCDFGCGSGHFIQAIKSQAKNVVGVELQEQHISNLNEKGIKCVNDLKLIPNDSIDLIVSFHVIEHLPDPRRILNELKNKLNSNGQLLIEVPHARDLLLSDHMNCQAFKEFTLWSQHLILHTKESLQKILESTGFEILKMDGVQRYPLSNHLGWLTSSRPGGHIGSLSQIDTPSLTKEYENALEEIDATDTIVALARKY